MNLKSKLRCRQTDVLLAFGMAVDKKQQPTGNVARDERPGFSDWIVRGKRQLGGVEYALLVLCLMCMAATIVTTWSLWQNRTDPPNLPMVRLFRGVSFGPIILLSLLVALFEPRKGAVIHFLVLAIAISFDLIRCQPQIFAMPVLMLACLWRDFKTVARWLLIAMWLWAGIHKLISPDWMGPSSWSVLDQMGFESAIDWYKGFAWVVAIMEIALALVAVLKPRWGAVSCVAMHLGIVAMLLSMHWNFSVLYWNIANATVGFWLFWTWQKEADPETTLRRIWPDQSWQQIVAVILLVSPAGVYIGTTPHFLAHVLYSDNMPRGMMTTSEGPVEVSTWDTLDVPIPKLPSIMRMYFESVANRGDKLHILDPRWPMKNQVFFMSESGERAVRINADFFWAETGSGKGVAKDYAPAVFYLEKAGVRLLKRAENEMIYAVEFSSGQFNRRLFQHIRGLLNLEQLQLSGCAVGDEDLSFVSELPRLNGLGLDHTLVTDRGLNHLTRLPELQHIEYRGTRITDEAIQELLQPR